MVMIWSVGHEASTMALALLAFAFIVVISIVVVCDTMPCREDFEVKIIMCDTCLATRIDTSAYGV